MVEKNSQLSILIIGISIVLAGISIGLGFYKGRVNDRYVVVKGLAEREVNADLAIWPITFKVTENDLGSLQRGIESSRETITRFLQKAGFDAAQISFSAPQIIDTETENRYNPNLQNEYRFIAQSTVTTRSNDISLVKKSMEKSGELVGKGVVLGEQSWQNPIEFIYTGLNDIKPAMIQQATMNAREAAEKFANDSGSKVGKIRHATQGYFSISDRDRNSPDIKVVRVVTTVQYFLVD